MKISSTVECAQIVDPDSGSVSVSSDGSVSTAVFSCASGYHIVGDALSVCDDNGSWNSTSPTCGICLYMFFITNEDLL